MKASRIFSLALSALCMTFAATGAALAGGPQWRPVDPAHLAQKAPLVEADADAEGIFWEARVEDDASSGDVRTVQTNYIRIKIFTAKGVEEHGKVDLYYDGRNKIDQIAARTIKPDGTIVDVQQNTIFERTIAKAGRRKLNAKSFAMPGVEPGAIIEYRWRETKRDQLANYVHLPFQQEFPVQEVKYYIKPLNSPYFPYGMRAKPFNCNSTPFVKESGGFYSTTLSNVPAFREEPNMPPENEVRPWMLVYYSEDLKLQGDAYWQKFGQGINQAGKSLIKVNDEIKRAATEAVGDATTPEAKIERIFEFCRTKIKNTNDDASGMTAEERAKLKENKSPADTLKRGSGTGSDIGVLFAAMASAAGFDARLAALGDRSDSFFSRDFADPYFIGAVDVAVKVGDAWRFYDPGMTYVPYGMLRWQEEGQLALVGDQKAPEFVQTPLSGPEKSVEKRTAKLKLDAEGTLEGDVVIEYTGHMAIERKEEYDEESSSEREDALREMVKERLSGAEVSDVHVENVSDPVKPFVYKYHVKVPGYAQKTGKRLFLQPAFFQKGVGPRFATSERRHPIYFHYPWSERDDVSIELPENFALDSADAPTPVAVGKDANYELKLAVTKDGRTLVAMRSLDFGGGGRILLPQTSYSQIKRIFDAFHERDNHTLTLKQASAAAGAATSSAVSGADKN